jgi:hypothetical protein
MLSEIFHTILIDKAIGKDYHWKKNTYLPVGQIVSYPNICFQVTMLRVEASQQSPLFNMSNKLKGGRTFMNSVFVAVFMLLIVFVALAALYACVVLFSSIVRRLEGPKHAENS